MKNNINFFISVAGFILAIFISSFIKLGFSLFLFLFFLSLIIFVFRYFFVSDLEEKQKILLIALFLLAFALGIFRYEIKDTVSLDQNLENNVGKKVMIEAVIIDEPANKESQVALIVDFKTLIDSNGSTTVSSRAIVSTGPYPEFKYGDLINISGTLKKPENFTSSSNKEFDYISYLEKDDIFYKVDFAKVSLISSGHGNVIKSFLFDTKNSFIRNINKTISEPESSLLAGILIGAKNSMGKDMTNIFRIAGLSHIVALSGYNITIVAGAIMKALSIFPRAIGLYGGVIGIMLFVILTGASSTAVRAGIMALIVILAQITRRDYQIGRALILAGLLMIIINPKILVFDLSFQLSFLATIAIIYLSPIIKTKLNFVSDRFGLRDIVSTTISAQILVLPLIIYKMGLLSLVALPSNILVLPIMPATMFFGFLTGILGFIFQALSIPFAWISFVLLAYMVNVAEFLASLPFAAVNINFFGKTIMVLCYVLIAYYIIYANKKLQSSKS